MIVLRPLVAMLMVLMLTLASLSLAVGRGQAPAFDLGDICSGGGLQRIPLDAQGDPDGPAKLCPDGLAALAVVAMVPPEAARRTDAPVVMVQVQPSDVVYQPVSRPWRARAPPVVYRF